MTNNTTSTINNTATNPITSAKFFRYNWHNNRACAKRRNIGLDGCSDSFRRQHRNYRNGSLGIDRHKRECPAHSFGPRAI